MSKSAAGTYLRYFEVFFITACIYLVLTFTVTRHAAAASERKMDGTDQLRHLRLAERQPQGHPRATIEKEGGVHRHERKSASF